MINAKHRVILAAVFLLGMSASRSEADITKHYEESIFKVGEKGNFGIEMIIPNKHLKMGVNSFDVVVHDAENQDVPGAEIIVVPRMPEMGHGVSEKPEVAERGGGVYTINNVVFSMIGHWEISVTVRRGDVEDTAVFDFPKLMAMARSHDMSKPKAADIDTSGSLMTVNRAFLVSYESKQTPVPLNKIHSWVLTVMTSDGKAVSGAKITVVGDMPEHGHGLPTRPEVTEELGDGKYLVEGFKFSMPGWWVVSFHIMAGGRMDSVDFNLLVQ